MTHNILYVEDEFEIRSTIQRWLSNEGYTVVSCVNEGEFKTALANGTFDLLLLDRQIPSSAGAFHDSLITLARARSSGVTTPAICMTAQYKEMDDIIHGQTDNLCQDYILKPVNTDLLRIKMRNLLAPLLNQPHLISKGHWTLDTATKSIKVGSDTVTLTATEFTTFFKLFERFDPMQPDRTRWVLTSQWDDLIGHHSSPDSSLRARIKELRKRLQGTAAKDSIVSRRKVGDREGGYALVS